jgi:hypothetical protein
VLSSFNAAHVRIGAVACLVISVRPRILDDPYESDLVRLAFEHRYRLPVVLMAQDPRGRPAFRGRAALVAAVRAVPVTGLPWRRYRP